MSTPLFTSIEETDLPAERQPEVPSVPPPMFTEIEATDVLRSRRRVLALHGKEAADLVGYEGGWN